MKIIYCLTLAAVGMFGFAGCATDTTTTATTQTETDQTTKRVHTQEELRKTGETNPAAALEKTDASIRTNGNR